jgi:rhamnulokinase
LTEHLAVDLGAESGRVIRGSVDGERLTLTEVGRFANRPLQLPDGLHWDVVGLFKQIVAGIRRAPQAATVGIDAWGVDYGLIDRGGSLLGLPFHYRDGRTEGVRERAFELVPREELYSVTGIQTLPINTRFQLLAEERSGALGAADRLLLIPDLFAFWLTGVAANEITAASTTGLLDAQSGRWALPLIERLGLPARPFGELVQPGFALGPVLELHDVEHDIDVMAVAGHDTASAFAAAPLGDAGAAIISSGTWSLVGMELDSPVLDERASAFDLTNERGLDGTTRLLSNVMGLWLVQECKRAWRAGYDELTRLAEEAGPDVPLFDPDGEALLAPGDMPRRLEDACAALGQAPPASKGELVRSILTSLACKYRVVIERLELVTRRRADTIHVIGGGARNSLLCRLTADITGRPVVAGPVEATAIGNLLVQARAGGEIGSLAEMRSVSAHSFKLELHEPARQRARWEDTYGRFLELTGLVVGAPA